MFLPPQLTHPFASIKYLNEQQQGRKGHAPPPAYNTFAKDMSLNRGATHFALGLRVVYLIRPIINIPAPRPPLKITQVAPL